MALNYNNALLIKKLADEIQSYENKTRKQESLKQYEIFNDRMLIYVKDFLKTFYNEDDISSLPIISSINLARRIVTSEASIYKNAPEREFYGVTPAQHEMLEEIYEDMDINSYMLKSNQYYKLQQQNNIQVMLSGGKLKLRVLLNHHFDVVPSPLDPSQADAYILSGYDKASLNPNPEEGTDNINQTLADYQDYQSDLGMNVLWSDDFNFLFNNNGTIIKGATPNPIGMIPFVDISGGSKDFEFFIRNGSSLTNFTVEFNAALTDMSQIVRMQGFAQGYLICSESTMPTSLKIGPAIALKMVVNPNEQVRPEFGFASPNADIAGSMGFLESLLALLLTSRGADPKSISGKAEASTYASGLERLLAQIESFEPSRQDFSTFEKAECKIFEIVKAYINTYAGTPYLKYSIAKIPDDAYVSVQFKGPEMIKTDKDKLEIIQQRLDMGLIGQLDAIMEDRGISEVEAIEVKKKIDKELSMNMPALVGPEPLDKEEIAEIG